MPIRYRVVLSGQILPGHTQESVRAGLSRTFRLAADQLEIILAGRRVTIKRDASADEATRLAARIAEIGMRAEVESFEVPATPAANPAPLAATPLPAQVPAPVAPPAPAAAGESAIAVSAAGVASDELFSLAPPPAPAASPVESIPYAQSTPETGPAGDSVTCPQCGEIQPRRTLCRGCGLDMPRHHAAQAALANEAREERAKALETGSPRGRMRDTDPGIAAGGASLLGFGFSGRISRMGYFGGGIAWAGVLFLLFVLSLYSGTKAFGVMGIALYVFTTFRLSALRLHDTGRSGWMALLLVVPVLGQILSIALLLMAGEELENEYGPVPAPAGGRAVLIGLVLCAVAIGLGVKAVKRDPVAALKMVQEFGSERLRQGMPDPGEAIDDDEDADADTSPADTGPLVRYAASNRVEIYTISGCDDCDSMRNWLVSRDIRFVDHPVDTNEAEAAALGEKLSAAGRSGNTRLPVVEVNGSLLPGNPSIAEVKKLLKPAQ